VLLVSVEYLMRVFGDGLLATQSPEGLVACDREQPAAKARTSCLVARKDSVNGRKYLLDRVLGLLAISQHRVHVLVDGGRKAHVQPIERGRVSSLRQIDELFRQPTFLSVSGGWWYPDTNESPGVRAEAGGQPHGSSMRGRANASIRRRPPGVESLLRSRLPRVRAAIDMGPPFGLTPVP
jgi:hypothetical protein